MQMLTVYGSKAFVGIHKLPPLEDLQGVDITDYQSICMWPPYMGVDMEQENLMVKICMGMPPYKLPLETYFRFFLEVLWQLGIFIGLLAEKPNHP